MSVWQCAKETGQSELDMFARSGSKFGCFHFGHFELVLRLKTKCCQQTSTENGALTNSFWESQSPRLLDKLADHRT